MCSPAKGISTNVVGPLYAQGQSSGQWFDSTASLMTLMRKPPILTLVTTANFGESIYVKQVRVHVKQVRVNRLEADASRGFPFTLEEGIHHEEHERSHVSLLFIAASHCRSPNISLSSFRELHI